MIKLLVLEERSVFERNAPQELFAACDVTVMSPYSTAAEIAARGGLVNTADLIAAIEEGQLAGAGLDVLDNEPVKPGHIMLSAPEAVKRKIVFSPHIAGCTGSAFARTYAVVVDNVRRIAAGERPVNIVNGL